MLWTLITLSIIELCHARAIATDRNSHGANESKRIECPRYNRRLSGRDHNQHAMRSRRERDRHLKMVVRGGIAVPCTYRSRPRPRIEEQFGKDAAVARGNCIVATIFCLYRDRRPQLPPALHALEGVALPHCARERGLERHTPECHHCGPGKAE